MEFIQGNIKVRLHQESDIEPMAELANNWNVARNLRDGFPHPYTVENAKDFISNVLKLNPPMIFAIEYQGEYVGNIGLNQFDDVYRRTAEIGYFLGEPYWNKGITPVAVKLILKYAFETLDIVRVHTGVFEYNQASIRVLEKCGFEKDGVFKKNVIKEGKLWDEHRYSIINPKYL